MEGVFVEMDRDGFLTHGKKNNQCAYCQYSNFSNLPGLSVFPFHLLVVLVKVHSDKWTFVAKMTSY